MNFKTPFKVLTTAALIGTLSLSAVAPGAAFAAEPTQLAEEQAANFEIKTVILEKDGQLVELSFSDYAVLVAGNETAANGYEVKYIVADNGEVFAFDTYALASAENTDQTANEILKALSENEQTTTAPEDIKQGEFDEDGKLVAGEDVPEAVDKTELTKAIEEAKAVEAKDEATAKALEESIAAAEAVVAKEDATAEEVQAALDTLHAAIEAATPVVVESVTAITQTIASGEATELEFEVNGEKYTKTTFDKKFGEEGYTVTFLSNKDTDEESFIKNGKATATADFKYAVKVSDKSGKAVNTPAAADFATVTVKSGDIVNVTEAALSTGLSYVTLNDPNATFVATKAINGLDKEVLPEEGEDTISGLEVVSATSSDTKVAYFEDGKIVPVKEGSVTFTVTFKATGTDTNFKKTVEVPVEIKAAQKADSIEKIENIKTAATATYTLPTPTVLDQFGEEFATDTVVTKVTDKDGKTVAPTADKYDFSAAGVYTVKLFADSTASAKEIGSYTVETVEVNEQTKADAYELAFTKDANNKDQDTLDIENPDALSINVVGKVNGAVVDYSKFVDGLQVKLSDDTVATANYSNGVITLNLKETAKAGDLTVTLQSKEGSLVTDLATTTVKVTNTAAQIKELKLADTNATAVKYQVAKASELDATNVKTFFDVPTESSAQFTSLVGQLTAGKDASKTEILKANMIKAVNFIERTEVKNAQNEVTAIKGKVQVILVDKYGGETFEFAAEVSAQPELKSAVITQAAAEATDEVQAAEATAATATVGSVKFTAAQAGKIEDADKYTINIVQGEATAENTSVEASAKLEDKTLTITLGATWDSDTTSSAPTELKADGVQALLTNAKITAIKANDTDNTSSTAVTVEEGELKGGTDKVESADAKPAVNQQITYTFSKAVTGLKANDVVKVGEVAGKVVSVNGATVVVEIPQATAVTAGSADATLNVKGEGETFAPLANVTQDAVKVTAPAV